MTTPDRAPTVVPPGTGPGVFPPPGVTFPTSEVKLPTSAGAGFSVLEYRVPPRFSPPPALHRQVNEDTAVYLLEGELRYWFEDGDTVATTGTLVHVPAGAWFRWSNERDEPARLLCVFAPGGFEGFFLELGKAVADADWNPAALGAVIGPVRERYGDEPYPAP
jgi:mannose-6-phosphate isomerase-like protein (cupin superfamily)